MDAPDLPDFQTVLNLGRGLLDMVELAECHGIACGLICSRGEPTANDFLSQLQKLEMVTEPGEHLSRGLASVFESSVVQLRDEEFGFRLWLPDDDQSLDDRTVSLAQWCTGLLAGLGSGQMQTLSEEASEALEDLRQIATAGISAEGDGEEDEVAYVEIVEYVRVVTMMLREDLRGPGEHDFIH